MMVRLRAALMFHVAAQRLSDNLRPFSFPVEPAADTGSES